MSAYLHTYFIMIFVTLTAFLAPTSSWAESSLKWSAMYQPQQNFAPSSTTTTLLQHKLVLRPTLWVNDIVSLYGGFSFSGTNLVTADSTNSSFNSAYFPEIYPLAWMVSQKTFVLPNNSAWQLQPLITSLYADYKLKHATARLGRTPKLWGKGLVYAGSVWDDYLSLADQASLTVYSGRTEWNVHFEKQVENKTMVNRDDREVIGAYVLFRSQQERVKFGFSWDLSTWDQERQFHLFDLYVHKTGDFFWVDGEFAYLTGSEDFSSRPPRFSSVLFPNPNNLPGISRAGVGFYAEIAFPRISWETTLGLQVGLGQGDLGDRKPDNPNSRYPSTETGQWVAGTAKAPNANQSPQLRDGHDNRFFFSPNIKPALILLNQSNMFFPNNAVQAKAFQNGRPQMFGQDYYSPQGEFIGNGTFFLHAYATRPLYQDLIWLKTKVTAAWLSQVNPDVKAANGQNSVGSLLGSELDLSLIYNFSQMLRLNWQVGAMLPGSATLASVGQTTSSLWLASSLGLQLNL